MGNTFSNLRCSSYRSAGDFSVIEDQTELSIVTQTLCLKPETYITFLRNLNLPACLQSYHCQETNTEQFSSYAKLDQIII